MKRRALIACLLAPMGVPVEAQAQDGVKDAYPGFPASETGATFPARPMIADSRQSPFGLSITVPQNGPSSPLLTVEALGRKVTFTTAEVMDILEGK